jgi:hypothetical protein
LEDKAQKEAEERVEDENLQEHTQNKAEIF